MANQMFGVVPPAVTPFFNDEIDYEAFRKHVGWLLSTGVAGVSVGGSTGEGHTLSEAELDKLVRIAREELGTKTLIAGVIRDCTRDAIRYAKVAETAGTDYLMIAPIHYFKPNDDAHYAFFKGLNDAVSTPIIIYNVVPTAVITPECMKRLVTLPRIKSIKQSGGDIHSLADMLHAVPPGFPVMSAIDDLLYSTYVIGAVGAIAAINTVLPDLTQQQFEAVQRGDHRTALDLHNKALKVWRGIEGYNMPAKIKAALRLRGQNVGTPRSPLEPISAAEEEALRSALAEIGLI